MWGLAILTFSIPKVNAASGHLSYIDFLCDLQPLRVKGWDRALVEYTIAMLSDSPSQSKLPLLKRLSEISCPGFNVYLSSPHSYNF